MSISPMRSPVLSPPAKAPFLVVDASQGIEAQTLANVYLALDNNLEIIPVINKIDLPASHPERVKKEIEDVIGIDASNAILASAKEGIGIKEILEEICERIPAPNGDPEAPFQALIFDSYYDTYRGVIPLIRVVNGVLKTGEEIRMMATGATYEVTEIGVYTPRRNRGRILAGGRRLALRHDQECRHNPCRRYDHEKRTTRAQTPTRLSETYSDGLFGRLSR